MFLKWFMFALKPQFHEKSMAFYPMSYFSKAKQGSANWFYIFAIPLIGEKIFKVKILKLLCLVAKWPKSKYRNSKCSFLGNQKCDS